MATAKTARSRGAPVKDNGVKLEEGLNVFKSDKFDSQSYVQSRCTLNEKVLSSIPKHIQTYIFVYVYMFFVLNVVYFMLFGC